MANPRMMHEFDELRVTRLTAATDSSITYERGEAHGTATRFAPVKFVGNKIVALCEDGDKPVGSLERVDADGSVVIAYEGSVTYAGEATPNSAVVGDGNGGVRDADADEAGTGTVGSSDDGRVVVFQ